MATMNDYTIYCTEEQTKKALELGAPIEVYGLDEISKELIKTVKEEGWLEDAREDLLNNGAIIGDDRAYNIPTAEEMMGWLEEKEKILIIIDIPFEEWRFDIYYNGGWKDGGTSEFNSRKQATLAAIDAALDYLIQNN